MLFTIAALATAGKVNGYKTESVVQEANTWWRAPVPPATALPRYGSQPSRWFRAFPTKGELLLPVLFLPIQLKDPENLGIGKLLVASRGLSDPHFAGTVILLVHYDEKGVVGLVLNRRTDVPLSRVLDLKAARDRSDPVYLGALWDFRAYWHSFSLQPSLKRLRTSSVGFI